MITTAMRNLLALTLIAALTACGGGGSDAPKPCVAKPIRVQLFGDSTMRGYDGMTKMQANPSPATDLQNEMNSRFGPGVVVVSLNATVGAGTKELMEGSAGYRPFPQDVNADLIVVNFGINDQDVVKGVSIDQYEANLRKIVATSPAPVLFETPNRTPGDNPRLAAYAQRMRDVAGETADTYTYVNGIPKFETYFGDLAHPNTELYRLIVKDSLAPAVATRVASMMCHPS